jgi:hypothetical protein
VRRHSGFTALLGGSGWRRGATNGELNAGLRDHGSGARRTARTGPSAARDAVDRSGLLRVCGVGNPTMPGERGLRLGARFLKGRQP